ncbi:MAG: hypothetical protein PHF11_02520 [Candidatus Omnitrophica bacterium]|nr:hypothetical protein [Candidatus Omnitrophota bacterium]
MRIKGMSLMEILAIIIIIAILAAIALPNFTPIREKVLDKEASASLKLIQAAEKIYRLETDFYYPYPGTTPAPDNSAINQNLKLSLPTGDDKKWDYTVKVPTSTGDPGSGCSSATRYSGPDTRRWRLGVDESEPVANATCP